MVDVTGEPCALKRRASGVQGHTINTVIQHLIRMAANVQVDNSIRRVCVGLALRTACEIALPKNDVILRCRTHGSSDSLLSPSDNGIAPSAAMATAPVG